MFMKPLDPTSTVMRSTEGIRGRPHHSRSRVKRLYKPGELLPPQCHAGNYKKRSNGPDAISI